MPVGYIDDSARLGNAGLAAAKARIDAGYDTHRHSVFLKTERGRA